MGKKEIFEIIKENSYMKYCICTLIENIKDTREYRDLKEYLENIIIPNINRQSYDLELEKLKNKYRKEKESEK